MLFIILILSSCLPSTSTQPVIKATTDRTALPQYSRQISDFNFLELGISYEEVVESVGKEDVDIGSGTYILEYNLADGSKIYLQFISLDSLDRAYIVYSDGQIKNIIEP